MSLENFGKTHKPGEVYREYDPFAERDETYRINPITGIVETLVYEGSVLIGRMPFELYEMGQVV